MKLDSFHYSPFVQKVRAVLDLLGRHYTVMEVAYGDRTELATLADGYIHVPVLAEDDGRVVCDSRRICEHLLSDAAAAAALLPPPFEGPIWAYADWCDGALEDVLFRIATPAIRDNWWKSPSDRALFALVKERKYGPGCLDQWQRQRDEIVSRANTLLAPTARTLAAQPFLFGASPTLADAALYGQLAMLHVGDPALPRLLSPTLAAWLDRLGSRIPTVMRPR
jgi:glutathione S-transferase